MAGVNGELRNGEREKRITSDVVVRRHGDGRKEGEARAGAVVEAGKTKPSRTSGSWRRWTPSRDITRRETAGDRRKILQWQTRNSRRRWRAIRNPRNSFTTSATMR